MPKKIRAINKPTKFLAAADVVSPRPEVIRTRADSYYAPRYHIKQNPVLDWEHDKSVRRCRLEQKLRDVSNTESSAREVLLNPPAQPAVLGADKTRVRLEIED